MNILQGKTAASGIAAGKICLAPQNPSIQKQTVSDPEQEILRLQTAFLRAEEQLQTEKEKADQTESELLNAHLMLLLDAQFRGRIIEMIRTEKVNAEYAAEQAGEQLARIFDYLEDPYLRARAEDMRHTARRVLDSLTGGPDPVRLKEPSILCAEELSPALLIRLDKTLILGLVSKKGSPLSHTAILAAGYGIPYLTGVNVSRIPDGEAVILDADKGMLILSPDVETREKYCLKEKEDSGLMQKQPSGTILKIYANIASEQDLKTVLNVQADGIGLFRTEFLFMNRNEAPDEEEQFQIYRRILEAMGEKEVRIRTLDAGSDKPIPFLKSSREDNPALGLRGIRVSLAFPELFRIQLRALLRAACYGNESLLFPMITSAHEIRKIREHLALSARELDARGEKYRMPRIGIMIETPAAALISEELGCMADFFSIGTNDLTQYTLALDRQACGMEDFYDVHHEAILKLIRMTIEGGHKNGIPVGICGKLGEDPQLLPVFLQEGLDEVSVPPSGILPVRRLAAKAEQAIENENKERL